LTLFAGHDYRGRMRGWCLLIAVAGCGRVGFAPLDDASAGDGALDGADAPRDGAAADAPPFVDQCMPALGLVPAPIVIAGVTRRVQTQTVVPGMTLTALTAVGGTSLGSTTSAADGSFTLQISTNNMPVAPVIELQQPGYVHAFDMPARSYWANMNLDFVAGPQADIDATYAVMGAAQDPARGSLYIAALDCGQNVIDGVELSTMPPSTIVYADSNGQPSATLAATSASGIGFALNVPLGYIEVHARKPGATFLTGYVEIQQHPLITAYKMVPQ
jgi:hypothetical protein